MPLIAKVGRKRWRARTLLIAISLFLWIGIALHFVPIWWMTTTSVKPFSEIYVIPPPFIPKNFTLIAYKVIFSGIHLKFNASGGFSGATRILMGRSMWLYIKNSIIITGGVMILQVLITSLVGYSLSKLCSPKWARIMFLFFIGTMLVPGQSSLIPKYLLLKTFPFATKKAPFIPFTDMRFPTLNLLNTYWAIILPSAYSGFSVLLFKGFFDTLPDEIINAARLDGATEFGIVRRVILPISKPVFAVVAYFSFNGAWNAFLWPLIVLSRAPKLYPLPIVFFYFQQALLTIEPTPATKEYLEEGLGVNALMALAIVQSIPCFIMFIIFREYLMKGIKLRGFK